MGASIDGELLRHLAGGERGWSVQPLGNRCQPYSGHGGVVQLAQCILDPGRVLGELLRLFAGGRRNRFGGVAQSLRQDPNGMQLCGRGRAAEPFDGAIESLPALADELRHDVAGRAVCPRQRGRFC